MKMGWEGELVRLVPLDKKVHFESCLRWINDPDVTEWLGMPDIPMTRGAEEAWFDRMEQSKTDIIFAIETLEGQHIGQSGIHGIDWKNGVATTGSYIAESDLRNQGFGTDAAKVRSHYCFEVLGLRLLTSGYLSGNERSKRMQEKAGYQEYGCLPDALWKRGKYRDHVMTYLTAERWRALQAEGTK